MGYLTNNTTKYILFFLALVMLLAFIVPNLAFADQFSLYGVKLENDNYKISGLDGDAWNKFLTKYSTLIIGLAGATTLTLGGALVLSIGKLGASAGNPQARSQAITGLMFTLMAIALMGGSGIVLGFFYTIIK